MAPAKAEDAGVKELVGTPITLGDDYVVPPAPPPPGPLDLVLSRGSDAASEETATITVRVKNISKDRQQVFFRRELLSFVVSGPDGLVSCDPQPDSRVPDKQAFRAVAPGGFIEATSRLIELCPDDTFARPGLYLARARFSPHVYGRRLRDRGRHGRLYELSTGGDPDPQRRAPVPQESPAGSLEGRLRVALPALSGEAERG